MNSVSRIQPPDLKDVREDIFKADQRSKKYKESFEISIITPMFGGSHQPGSVDEKNPIRSSSIRGHLRFWWRATRGAAFPTVAELRKREIQIFGDTHTPSRIKIWVQVNKVPAPWNNRVPNYVSFSLKNEIEKDNVKWKENQKSLQNFSFQLHVQYREYISDDSHKSVTLEDLKAEIYPALWAWINFGGIGSRTRRGCGSLYCKEFAPDPDKSFESWFEDKLHDYKLQLDSFTNVQEWPTLSKTIYVQRTQGEILPKWNEIILFAA